MKFARNAVTPRAGRELRAWRREAARAAAKTTTPFATAETNRRTSESGEPPDRRRTDWPAGRETGIGEAPGKRAFDNASFFRVLGVFHFKQRSF